MRIRQFAGNVIKVGILGACVYGIVKWQDTSSRDSDASTFAEKACVDAVKSRYDVTSARPYDIRKSNDGFVVRVTVTTPGGTAAKVTCLTNTHGGVRETLFDQR